MESQPMRAPLIGQEIPNMFFDVYQNESTKRVSFKDFAGKWLILFFYPADFTFVCPTELEQLANLYSKFQEQGAEVISFSTDTVFVHKAWHDHSEAIKKVQYPMGADPTGDICRMMGTYIATEGVSLRGTFVLDPNGKIVMEEINANGIGRNAVELLRKVEAAKFIHEHGDQVCPANWHPGEKTLKPGMELVGKI